MSKKVTESLKQSLANTYVLYNKFQNYHWNLKGPNFFSLHTFFEDVYTKLAQNIDALAERIRFFDEVVPVGLSFYVENASIQHALLTENEKEALQDLIHNQSIIIKCLKKTMAHASENSDIGTETLIGDLISYHEKVLWLLKSNLS